MPSCDELRSRLGERLLSAFESAGGTNEEIGALGEDSEMARNIIDVLRRTHEIRPRFPIWRTVRRGVHKTVGAYLAAMAAKKYMVSRIAGDHILSTVVWAQKEDEEELVRVLDTDLGLTGPYTLSQLFAAAARFGLYRLDTDVAAGLRVQYDDQLPDEWLLVAMDPIEASDGYFGVFVLERNRHGTLLSTLSGDTSGNFGRGTTWVFSRRKPTSAT